MSMLLFNDSLLTDVISNQLEQLKDEIKDLSLAEMENTTKAEWVDYFVSEYTLESLKLYPETMELEDLEDVKIEKVTWISSCSFDPPETAEVQGVNVSCKVGFSGNSDLFRFMPQLHQLQGFSVDSIEEPSDANMGYLHFSLEQELSHVDEATIIANFKNSVTQLEKEMQSSASITERYNNSLEEVVKCTLDKKLSEAGQFAKLRESLNIPLKRNEGAPSPVPITLPKREIKISKPKQNVEDSEYTISDDDYKHITDVVHNFCACWETAPSVFNSHNEEELRLMILGVLNSHYDNATGETFRNKGKTDIFIQYKNKAAYIAECKVWKGQAQLRKAVSQLFSYTTWRDTKVSLIIFNKDIANFDEVVNKIDRFLTENAIGVKRDKHEQWICKILNNETEQVMTVTVQVFNLYSK